MEFQVSSNPNQPSCLSAANVCFVPLLLCCLIRLENRERGRQIQFEIYFFPITLRSYSVRRIRDGFKSASNLTGEALEQQLASARTNLEVLRRQVMNNVGWITKLCLAGISQKLPFHVGYGLPLQSDAFPN